MLDTLITSRTRLKLLIKFFVYASNKGYLRGLAEEFHESTNSIRKELNQLTDAGYLTRVQQHNKVMYQANRQHPLFASLQRLIHDHLGVDHTIDAVLDQAGNIEEVSLQGNYAKGIDSGTIDFCVLGKNLDTAYLLLLADKTALALQKKVKISFEKQTKPMHHIVLYKKENI